MSGEYTFGASDDIVRRIRENLPHIEWEQPLAAERERLAAAEIERLRAERDASRLIISDLTAEVERLRAENDAYRQVYVDEAEFLEAFANWDGTRENLPLGWKWEQWDKKNEQ